MTPTTYSQFQGMPTSEKIGLVQILPSLRLTGWVVHSGSVYKITSFDYSTINSIKDDGTALVAVSDLASVIAGKYWNDRDNDTIYIRLSDSSDPNDSFTVMNFTMFFSNINVKVASDLTTTGNVVEWLPYVISTSNFKREIDNIYQFGTSIDGNGSLNLFNDKAFWSERYDKISFENQVVKIYSWHRDLAITEAKLIFKGYIEKKTWSDSAVTFQLKDVVFSLKNPVPLDPISDVLYSSLCFSDVTARVPDNLLNAKQRLLYGRIWGFVPTNIDQILDGYPVDVTVTVTNGDATITGSGFPTTLKGFLKAGDRIKLGTDPTNLVEYEVDSWNSATSFEMTETYAGSTGTAILFVLPNNPGRQFNRVHKISGHALSETATTLSAVTSASIFDVVDSSMFRPGDVVLIDGEEGEISSISNSRITLVQPISAAPSVSDTFVRPPVQRLYIAGKLVSRDLYSVDETNGKLTLNYTDDATHAGNHTTTIEYDLGTTRNLTGTWASTTGSATVTGTSSKFSSEIEPGDFISNREVLRVASDTSLELVSNSLVTTAAGTTVRKAFRYNPPTTMLTCDMIGKAVSAVADEAFEYGPEIVQDILTVAGASALLNETSFTNANADVVYHPIGVAIPETYADNRAPLVRDVVTKINKSIFGLLYQDANFELSYDIIQPNRINTVMELFDADIIDLGVSSDSSRAIGEVVLSYKAREYDQVSKAKAVTYETASSSIASYVTGNTKILTIDTVLAFESSAEVFAARLLFLFENATNILTIKTKMQGMLAEINDTVLVDSDRLYERFGTTESTQKMGLVRSVQHTILGATLELDDLGNAFTKTACIAADDADDFSEAAESEQTQNGYFTDTEGMIDGDGDTFGTNLIW